MYIGAERRKVLHLWQKGKGVSMEELLKEAIITTGGKIKCPVCGKTNGMITGQEKVENFRIRCKSSRRGHEHFFVLNAGKEDK